MKRCYRKGLAILAATACIINNVTVAAAEDNSEVEAYKGAVNTYPIIYRSASNHYMIVTNDSKEKKRISMFGDNSRGQCGKSNTESYLTEPNSVIIAYPDGSQVSVREISAGGKHSMAMSNCVWTWGDNTYGQLGRETADTYDPIPAEVDFSEYPDIVYFVAIAAGEDHCLALDQSGNLYAWGRNNYYQLGRDDIEYSAKPIKIAENIKWIETRFNHNLISDTENHLYAFGDNEYGQLGIGDMDVDKCADITEVAFPNENLRAAGLRYAVGEHHSVALTYDQTDRGKERVLYAWGDNSKYQLGIDDSEIKQSSVPLKVIDGEGDVECGRDYTIFDNRYWFGTGCAINEVYPENVLKTPTARPELMLVTPGYDGGLQTSSNYVNVWGMNDRGQLMQEPDNEYHYLKTIPFVNIEPQEKIPYDILDGAKIKIKLNFLQWRNPPRDWYGKEYAMEDVLWLIDAETDQRIGRFSKVEILDDTHAVGTVKFNDDFVPEEKEYTIVVYGHEAAVTTLGNFYGLFTMTAEKTEALRTLTVTADNPLKSGAVNQAELTAELTGAVFTDALNPENWSISGADGITVDSIDRIDDRHAKLRLKGNNADKYEEKQLEISCSGSEYLNSMIKDEEGNLIYSPLKSNIITLEKQKRSRGSRGSGSQSKIKPSPTPQPTASPQPTAKPTMEPQLTIKLTIGSNTAEINGRELTLDAAARIKDDLTFVPIRFIAEALGSAVSWNELDRRVTIERDSTEIRLNIGSESAYINDIRTVLNAAPFIFGDRTYVPQRFIAEAFGAYVEWNETDRTVIITK